MKKFLALAVLAMISIAGCGPEKSSLDLEREKRDEMYKQKAAENQALAGDYEGTLKAIGENGTSLEGPFNIRVWIVDAILDKGGTEKEIISVLTAYASGKIATEAGGPLPEEDSIGIQVQRIASNASKIVFEGKIRSGEVVTMSITKVGDKWIGTYTPTQRPNLPGMGFVTYQLELIKVR